MHSLNSSFVLGFHGCERSVAESVLSGERTLQPSDNDYDWLGPGIYFWEANPLRGKRWAEETKSRGKIKEPYVIGAVIDLGYCLDLMSQNAIEHVKIAYNSLKKLHDAVPDLGPLPTNKGGSDRFMRRLDCAVIRHLHSIRNKKGQQAFDTVRGLFQEGAPIYPDSGFYHKTHVQIAVCNPKKIKGVFRVPDSLVDTA